MRVYAAFDSECPLLKRENYRFWMMLCSLLSPWGSPSTLDRSPRTFQYESAKAVIDILSKKSDTRNQRMVPGALGAQINGVKTIDAGEVTQEFESAVSGFLSMEDKYSLGRTATWENTDYQRQFDFGYVQHQH